MALKGVGRPRQRDHLRPNAPLMGTEEMVAALRTIPYGGIDDTARNLALSPRLRANISPVIHSARWSALLYGMIFGAAEVFDNGSSDVVLSLTVCLFLTSWRTIIPLRLGSKRLHDQVVAVTDAAVLGLGAGYSGAFESPYVFCVIAAVTIAGFGWGYVVGTISLTAGSLTLILASTFSVADRDELSTQISITVFSAMVLAPTIAAFIQARLLEAEERRVILAGKVDTLTETNELLTMLNSVTRTLPTSLNRREALEEAREQIVSTFHGNVICLMEHDGTQNEWSPKLAEGCTMRPSLTVAELPSPLRLAMRSRGPILIPDLSASPHEPVSRSSASGLYVRLVARNQLIGVLAIEDTTVGSYGRKDLRLLTSLAAVLALTLDNARWFARLRSLGAEEERVRIARDLHDRLGQWLTYIALELERIIAEEDEPPPELRQLYSDIQTALDELRETLRQLRAGVSEDMSLSLVGAELVQRFEDRTGIPVTFEAHHDLADRLPIPVENELLRILQEALNNTDRHARASHVDVSWTIDEYGGTLRVADDGIGFDASRGVRDSAYGLVGMRERADAIGGRLTIDSSAGQGTTITVVTSNHIP